MSRIRGFHAEIIKDRFKGILEGEKDYEFFDGSLPHNVNIIGIRNMAGRVNKFDDILLAIYRDTHKRWLADSYQITTDPGLYWLKKPMNVNGTAILCPGQYRGAYQIDKHRGKYDALCQLGAPISVWRDGNLDGTHDMSDTTIATGYFGVNLHKAGRSSTQVDKWSAGCQVFKNDGDFKEFMTTIRASEKRFGNSFTYTLIESTDIDC
tara:strand:- start:508 stop:1131 length:624 start_codon:yes stop_codon:yes gene_type:complete